MSELKRVPLTTLRDGTVDGIPSTISSRKSSFSATAAALLQGHHEAAPSTSGATSASVPSDSSMTSHQQASKTFRLELELFEPNSNSFPEFNYLKLVHLEKKKLKKLKSSSKVNGFADPFEENDDEVAKIAKELEKKYGSSYGSGRGKSKKDDYYDKGAGYDESDSFIDNTEAYDEIIPEEVETVEGGFYINSGALEFKHLSNYERSEDTIKLPKTKKRALSSSSSSEESEKEPEAEAETEGNVSPKQASTANKLKNGHMDKKQKGNDGSDRDTNSKPKNKDKKSEKIRPKDDSKDEEVTVETAKDKEKAVKTTTVKDMLKAKRDSFRKMQEGEVKMKMINGETAKTNQNGDSSESSGDDSDSEEEPSEKKFKKGGDEDPEKMRTSDTKLSEELSEDLLKDVHELKDTAKSRNQCGKNFQFDDKITEIFLRIDDACSCLDKSTRNQVFAHIEYQLSLSKYYLLRKAKQLRIKQEKTKTKKAYMKLRKAVAEVMPSILLTYEANCRKVNDIRAKIPSDELSKMEQPPKYPKKKFPWTETLRNLLYELFQVRWTSYTVLRTRKETFEDFVNNYLKEKVAAIWPPGWMKYDDLKKELDKRKQSAKKPKENKKPGDIVPLSKNKLNDETSITIVEKSTEPAKSVLSTSNSMSVVSTKDLVVTITTKSIEKSTEVPNASAQNNTVSITQIPVDSGNSSKGRNSPVLTKSEAKAYKSSSGNSTNSSRNSPLPMQADQNHLNSKQIGQGTAAASVNSNYVKSSKSSSDKTSSNSNSCSNVNSHHKSVILTTNSISKGPIDLASPTKRATDHSINSIMSSPSPSPVQQHSSINLTAVSPSAISAVGSTKGTDSNTTHVITVDHLKNATDIINTTNQLLNNNNPNVPHNNAGNCNPSKECPIRIRSVANVNSSIEREQKKDKLAGNIRAISERTDHESSSESDGVEIVGVYPVLAKKSANITVNKNKYIKPSSGDSSGNNFAVNKANHKVKVSASDSRRNAEHILMSTGEVKEAELDVNQIMRALKELEEMQQSSIHISDGSPPASNSRSNVNSHAPITYGKDIKQ